MFRWKEDVLEPLLTRVTGISLVSFKKLTNISVDLQQVDCVSAEGAREVAPNQQKPETGFKKV